MRFAVVDRERDGDLVTHGGREIIISLADLLMKIAHVVSTFPPYRGGTGSVCYYNAREAARLGHDVTVFTQGRSASPSADPSGVEVIRLPVRLRIGNAPILAGLASQLERFEIVHLHYPFYSGAEVVWFRRQRVPYVATYHQDVLLPGALGIAAKSHHAFIGARIVSDARMLIVTTLDYARSSRVAPLLERQPERVREVPNGVEAVRFGQADGHTVRQRHGIGEDVVALFVGGLDRPHYFKGVDVMLDALARHECAAIKTLIVGDGDLRPQYEKKAAELGIAERVVFAGSVSEDDLPRYYAAADFLVLPSINAGEAFGLVLLEAFASGIPAVTSNLPGVRVVAGEEALLAKPGDAGELSRAIATMASDRDRRRQMGTRAQARVRSRFDWGVIGPRLVEVYEEALRER